MIDRGVFLEIDPSSSGTKYQTWEINFEAYFISHHSVSNSQRRRRRIVLIKRVLDLASTVVALDRDLRVLPDLAASAAARPGRTGRARGRGRRVGGGELAAGERVDPAEAAPQLVAVPHQEGLEKEKSKLSF